MPVKSFTAGPQVSGRGPERDTRLLHFLSFAPSSRSLTGLGMEAHEVAAGSS